MTTAAQVQPSPVWSPDGSEIVYCSQRMSPEKADFVVTTLTSDGAGQGRVIYRSSERIEPTDWSYDGRYLLVDRGNIGAQDVWVIPLDGSKKAFPLVQTQFSERAGQFSPDGRWVAYHSLQTSRNEIYVTAFPEAARDRRSPRTEAHRLAGAATDMRSTSYPPRAT